MSPRRSSATRPSNGWSVADIQRSRAVAAAVLSMRGVSAIRRDSLVQVVCVKLLETPRASVDDLPFFVSEIARSVCADTISRRKKTQPVEDNEQLKRVAKPSRPSKHGTTIKLASVEEHPPNRAPKLTHRRTVFAPPPDDVLVKAGLSEKEIAAAVHELRRAPQAGGETICRELIEQSLLLVLRAISLMVQVPVVDQPPLESSSIEALQGARDRLAAELDPYKVTKALLGRDDDAVARVLAMIEPRMNHKRANRSAVLAALLFKAKLVAGHWPDILENYESSWSHFCETSLLPRPGHPSKERSRRKARP